MGFNVTTELHAKLGVGSAAGARGLAGLRDDAPISDQAPLVWRAPEELEGPGCGARGRWWGLAAVPVGGGGAWPGFEATRRAEGSQRGRRAGGPPPMAQPGPTG